jgi:periplasmic protein TonB
MAVERSSKSEENIGSLRGCLVEGDPEQRRRERSVRRRALLVSILLQSTALIALVLIPLFAKPTKLVQPSMPVPFYSHVRPRPTHPDIERAPTHPMRNPSQFFAPRAIPPTIVTHDQPEPPSEEPGPPVGNQVPALPEGIPLARPNSVRPPAQLQPDRPRIIHPTHLDPAMLIHRVEPIYPPLARQIGRSGRVELRAMIATDGTIQSLQAVSGDPMFYQSAMDAVNQWRYKPTVLNGQLVEVDTFITVIYNIPR